MQKVYRKFGSIFRVSSVARIGCASWKPAGHQYSFGRWVPVAEASATEPDSASTPSRSPRRSSGSLAGGSETSEPAVQYLPSSKTDKKDDGERSLHGTRSKRD